MLGHYYETIKRPHYDMSYMIDSAQDLFCYLDVFSVIAACVCVSQWWQKHH